MRIAVLGPLEVSTDDGRPVTVPGAKERLLLAVLAAGSPDVVSTDRIVETLWNGDRPVSARKSLQAHLVHLRSALEPDRPRGEAGHFVVRRGSGYALATAADDVDALRMVDLAVRGRALLNAGDAAEAARLLASALALWRGEPYGDWPDASFADAERRRLAEVRVGAVTALLEARLTLGEHTDVVAEAERLLADDPLQEEWWRLLVLALYRCGRQGDALAAVARARAVLVEQLGVEPGPRLRAVEAAVLAQDPALDVLPPPGRGPPSSVCPYKGLAAYQAADAGLFHGRARVVSTLVARLVDAPLIVVSGSSGVGKSSLVRAGLLPALAAGALPDSAAWRAVVLTPGRRPDGVLEALTSGPQDGGPTVLVVDQLEELWAPGVRPAARSGFLDEVLRLIDDGGVVRCVTVVRGDHVGQLAEHAALTERLGGALVLVPPMTEDEIRDVVRGPASTVGMTVDDELLAAVVADVRGQPAALPLLSTALVGTWERRRGNRLTLAGYLEAGGVAGALTRSAEDAYAALDDAGRDLTRGLLVRLADVDDGGALVRRPVPLTELAMDGEGGAARRQVVETFVRRRLLSVDGVQVEVTHEALLTAWPRLSRWLEDDATGRSVRRHLAPAAREWADRGRTADELYRGARLAAALDWAAIAGDELTPVERQFLEASRARADAELREAHQRADREAAGWRATRRLAIGLAAGLVAALIATGLAVRASQDAERASRVADAGRLATLAGTTDVADLSLLLAAQAARLADLPETRSTLLSSVIGHGRVLRVAPMPLRINEIMTGPGETVFVDAGDGELFEWPLVDAEPQRVSGAEGAWVQTLDASSREPVVVGYGWGRGSGVWLGLQSSDGATRDIVSSAELGGEPLAASFTSDGARVLVVVGEGDVSPGGVWLSGWRLVEVGVADGSMRDIGPRAAVPIDDVVIDVDDGGRSVVVAGVRPSVSAELMRVADGRRVPLRLPDKVGRTADFVALPAGAAQIWSDGEVTVYDEDGRPRQTLDAVTRRVRDLVVAPDGTWAATVGSAGTVVLWDVDRSTGLWTFREELVGHAGDVVDAAITADGDRLVTAGVDRRLVVWDPGADGGFGTAVPGFGDRFPIAPPQIVEPRRVAVAPTMPIEAAEPVVGPSAPSPVPVAATFFDPVTGEVLQEVAVGTAVPGTQPAPSASVSPDRSMVAVTTGSTVTVLDATSRREVGRYVPPPQAGRTGDAEPSQSWCAGWTPDSLLVVCAQDVAGLAVQAVDPRTGEVLRANPVGFAPTALATDPARNRLAMTGPEDGMVVVLDAGTFVTSRTLSSITVTWPAHLSFSPDGRRIAVAGEGGLTVIDTETWRAVPAPAPLTGDVLQAEWFPDSRTVAVAGSDRTVYLYDVEQGQVRVLPLPAAGDGSAQGSAVHLLPGISDQLVVHGGSLPGRRYPLDPGAWSRFACTVAGRDLTKAEWSRYLPDREYRPACSGLG